MEALKKVAERFRALTSSAGKQAKKTMAVPLYSQTRSQISPTASTRGHLARTFKFNAFIVFIILVDSMLVGIEVDHSQGDTIEATLAFWCFDLVTAVVFLAEMVVRMHQLGWEYFADPWNIFDYICVSVGGTALVQPTRYDDSARDAVNLRIVKTLKGIRILRLLRIVRHIGGLKMFEGMWLIVSTLLSGLKTLLWIGIFMLICVYVFAVMLVTMTGNSEQLWEYWPDADIYIGSVYRAMITVFQVLTLDAWASEVARPIFEVVPEASIVFFMVIVTITFGIVNIILAVMVEHIRQTIEENRKKTEKKLQATEGEVMQNLRVDFSREADLDRDGQLSHKEFCRLLTSDALAFKLRLCGVHFSEADELFQIIDVDNSGYVSPEEFLMAFEKMKGPASGQDLVHVICFAEKQCSRAELCLESIRKMSEHADVLQERLNMVGAGLTKEITVTKENKQRGESITTAAMQRRDALRKVDEARRTTFPQASAFPFPEHLLNAHRPPGSRGSDVSRGGLGSRGSDRTRSALDSRGSSRGGVGRL